MRQHGWMRALVVLMAVICLGGIAFAQEHKETITLSYNEMMELAQKGDIIRVNLGAGEKVQLILQDGSRAQAPNPRSDDFKLTLLKMGVDVRENAGLNFSGGYALLFLLPVLFLMLRRNGAPGFVRAERVQADSRIPPVTFDDVAADGEALRCMRELVDFLKDPQKYAAYGARLPRGVMLYGPPGTGKTLLAKALAGEAKAPFFSMNGADFVQVYVGVGASRVRELFRKARKAGGGVIFIDEIDAIGKKRDSANDEREQTLNALLTEMSGFSEAEGIVVLAATNRLDTLDEALLRAGRFDRQIEVGLPDRADRLKILQVHARNKPLAQDVSLDALAMQTVMFSGAQLESLLNEAAIRAAQAGRDNIGREDVEKAYLNVLVGSEKDHVGDHFDQEKRITAYHEAGHALLTHLLLPGQQVTRLSILPSCKGAAGYTLSLPQESMFQTRQQLLSQMITALGGRAAEEVAFGREQVTTGAANDFKRARHIARKMACDWEMGETGDTERDARQLFSCAYDKARTLLVQNRHLLDQVAASLIDHEQLSGAEFLDIMKKSPPCHI